MINASINTPAKISVKSLVIGDVSKRSLGLDAIDNTSDLDKPISTAQQTAIDLKGDQATTYTKVASDSLLDLKADQATTYTKTEVDTNIANLVAAAPQTLDTLNELAAALGNDENFATTVTAAIATNTANIVAANENNGYTILQVDVNTGDIATNAENIVAANEAIEANTAAIEDNSDAIATNTFNVNANKLNLQLWTSNNATAISVETSRATTAEGINATAISDETTRATTAEGINATAIALNTAKVGITTAQADAIEDNFDAIETHTSRTNNPHGVTALQIGVTNGSGGGEIGLGSDSTTGGAVGYFAKSTNGFAGGDFAKAQGANRVQLGNGTNSTDSTIQFLGSGSITAAQFGNIADIALKAPLASPAFTGGATIDGADILHLNNIGIEVQPWSTILDDTTASFTHDIELAITDNSAATALNAYKVEYPYTTTFISGVEQTSDITSIAYQEYLLDANIQSIYIGSNVTSIDTGAFNYATSLTSVTISNSVTSIGSSAFAWASNLKSINIPNSITSIADNILEGTAIETIDIPDSVLEIGNRAFYQCTSLTSITIPDNVTSIGGFAFFNCTDLASVTLPTNVNFTTIGASVFRQSAITSITIPDNVTSIENRVFLDCTSLTSATIGNSVTTIGNFAFRGCTDLASVTLPTNVNFTSIGTQVFYQCSGLTSIIIPDSVTSLGNYAFSGCSSLTSITIPDSVTSIGDNVFAQCTSLNSITSLAVEAPTLGSNTFFGIPATTIQVPIGATGYGTTYGGLTVQAVL